MSKPDDMEKQQEPKRFRIDSQEKSHEFRKFQETAKCLTFESICINELVYEVKILVNGANGTIRDIIFLISSRNNLPQTIFIEFEHYTGPNFFLDFHPKKKWTPINSYNSYAKNLGCSRTQFPLRLAYALTAVSIPIGI
jgi:hypothetical protein